MKLFLKIVFGNLVAFILLAFLAFFFIGGSIAALVWRETPKVIPDKAVLVFDMNLHLTDAPPASEIWDIVQRSLGGSLVATESLRTVVETIDRAADDPKITGLHLSGSFVSGGYGSGFPALREVRLAVERFQASGKPVIAYLETPSLRDYYVASAADEIHLNPYGLITMSGMASQQVFLAGLLEKYGVGVQVTRAGRYKSAVEMFTETGLTEENREQTQVLLHDIWEEFLHAVGTSRGIDGSRLQRVADERGFLEAEDALAAGLVDAISYFDEMLEAVRIRTGQRAVEALSQVEFATYAAAQEEKPTLRRRGTRDRIALVYVEGDIVDGEGISGMAGSDRLAREIRRLRSDEQVRAMVVRVNSPGGSVTAAEAIRRELSLAAESMPLVVSFGSLAASGGYWIATDADRIFSQPHTITGSIGVFGLLLNFQELANRHGVTFDSVKTGEFADLLTIARPKSDREMEVIQDVVDRIYREFLERVAHGRKISLEEADRLGQGRIWSGLEALRVGLVDEIGGLGEAIQHAASEAGLEQWTIVEFPRRREWAEVLAESWGGEPTPPLLGRSSPVDRLLGDWHHEYRVLQSLNDPRGVYLRMPFSLQIR